jgi:serine/threonine-protein kinase RsbW
MAVCTLAIPPDTEQVRVARLVATAAARRTGLAEPQIDDVRLAVGEAVGRAVVRQQRAGDLSPVRIRMVDEYPGFVVEVVDTAAGVGPDESPLALAVITGLVPTVDLDEQADRGQVVRMQWSAEEPDDGAVEEV